MIRMTATEEIGVLVSFARFHGDALQSVVGSARRAVLCRVPGRLPGTQGP